MWHSKQHRLYSVQCCRLRISLCSNGPLKLLTLLEMANGRWQIQDPDAGGTRFFPGAQPVSPGWRL